MGECNVKTWGSKRLNTYEPKGFCFIALVKPQTWS